MRYIMQSKNQEPILNMTQKSLIVLLCILIISSSLVFRNIFFKPTYLLKSFGELSIDPLVAFKNNKPTFLEFYAEWCEVCKEMAPKLSELKKKYNEDINFVFLNVDNPKWESYVRKFAVNGIPQINLFDKKGNLKTTFIGKQEEKTVRDSLESLESDTKINVEIFNSDFSPIKEKTNNNFHPRSHG